MDKSDQKQTFYKKIVLSYNYVLDTMYKPTHPASLAVARILFGILMLLDIADERGGAQIDIKWGEPKNCYFPLFPQIKRPELPWMCVMYGIMWIGAFGISLGYKFKLSCLAFCLPYWYILLLEKSFWNNHSYLYGLVSMLFLTTSANNFWSVDSYLNKKNNKDPRVPYWNYFILKFQFFLLYFYAGLKKTDQEWLEGYSMSHLGRHWVFSPFSIFLSVDDIDYLIIHWSGFLLDLTVGFFLIYQVTRPFAMVFCSMFHIMNTRLFSIGMFPYVCLATMPLFCKPDWPITLMRDPKWCGKFEADDKKFRSENPKKPSTVIWISIYCLLQLFLPYSHFITKGYNNWTNGLYGYSWDMMVHSWDTTLVVVRVVDNNSGKEHYLDPDAWAPNDRWNKHADMCLQYAQCLKKNLLDEVKEVELSNEESSITQYITSDNLSIYIDVWCSLNGRFQQRMYNPQYDMLRARWSPFEPVEWLLPLLTEYNDLRNKIKQIQEHVYTWSNYSDVLFIADFPGLFLENYITSDLINVTLTIIEGEVYYESENYNMGLKLAKGSSIPILSDVFHKIHTLGDTPSCFMYTFSNKTKEVLKEVIDTNESPYSHSPIPLLEESTDWLEKIREMMGLISNSVLYILYDVPMVRRTRIIDEV